MAAVKKTSTDRKKANLSRTVEVRALTTNDWPTIEKLFGEKGVCGGCWCMSWRLPQHGKLWEQNKGEPNKRAFKKLVKSGKVHACLAFLDDTPVGWCCIGPRGDFPRLARIKALQTKWDDDTWSVVCFYIKTGYRHQGIATKMLNRAASLARSLGAKRLEGYPVTAFRTGNGEIPAAFAWTGVKQLFEKQKFVNISLPQTSRDVYLKRFRQSKSST